MNWASPVYICRTLDTTGNGSSADFADAVEEITDYAVANNLHAVINYSGGGAANLTKQEACQYAQARGVLLCAATGNDNAGPVIWPAAYSTTIDNVIAVGSTDANDMVSSFSNVGPEVTVVAPGRGILSTMPTYDVTIPAALNYDYLDGTSMATPLVTGLVSLMWSRHPGFTYRDPELPDQHGGQAGAGNLQQCLGQRTGGGRGRAALRRSDLPDAVHPLHAVHPVHPLHAVHAVHPLHEVHALHALHEVHAVHSLHALHAVLAVHPFPARSRASTRSAPSPAIASSASAGPSSSSAKSRFGASRS